MINDQRKVKRGRKDKRELSILFFKSIEFRKEQTDLSFYEWLFTDKKYYDPITGERNNDWLSFEEYQKTDL